eukprot:scaffold7618_cov30-Tisochrysis_lutea.AAC.1
MIPLATPLAIGHKAPFQLLQPPRMLRNARGWTAAPASAQPHQLACLRPARPHQPLPAADAEPRRYANTLRPHSTPLKTTSHQPPLNLVVGRAAQVDAVLHQLQLCSRGEW